MNLNISPMNFKGTYQVTRGGRTSMETDKQYEDAIRKINYVRELAVKSQQFMERADVQAKIFQMPNEDQVRFRNLYFDNKTTAYDLETRVPVLTHKTTERFSEGLKRATGDVDYDYFEFELDENRNLNEEDAIKWIDRILDFHA